MSDEQPDLAQQEQDTSPATAGTTGAQGAAADGAPPAGGETSAAAPPAPAIQEPTGPWAIAGRKPISDASPAGESARYEDAYQSVLREVEKLDSLTAQAPDWHLIQTTALNLLTNKTKDITLASYATLAMFQREGFGGLRAGLDLCSDLLENFWETLWPEKKRIRARVNALEWLSERCGSAVGQKEPPGSEKANVHACKEGIERLTAVAARMFGSEGPSLADLKRAILDQISKVGPLVSEATAGAEARKPATTGVRDEIGAGEIKSADDARRLLLRASGLLRQFSPTESTCYRLPRAVNWSRIQSAPPNESGKTKIPGVQGQRREALAKLHADGKWDVLLNGVETVFPEAPFWLDLQRYADSSFAGLGTAYEGARQGVRDELRALLRRVPGLTSLSFQDGSAFCDGATRMWVESEVMTAGQPAGGGASSAATGSNGEMEAALREAKSIAGSGEFPKAVELFQKGIARAGTLRERFLWSLEMAKICLTCGREQLADPILERLDDEVVRYHLEEWEPGLSLEVIRLRYQLAKRPAGTGRPPTPESMKRIEELFSRLCRLDVAAALAMEGGG